MATLRDIATTALRRLSIIDATEQATSEDAAYAVDRLNEMVAAWNGQGMDPLYEPLTLNDPFRFFVPPAPKTIPAETRLRAALHCLDYKGEWDADTNTPTLATATGTTGHAYKVSVPGATLLDGVASWAEGDYLLFDGQAWLKSPSSARYDRGVACMLAMEISDAFGQTPPVTVAAFAAYTFSAILGDWCIPGETSFEDGLVHMPSRRYIGYTS